MSIGFIRQRSVDKTKENDAVKWRGICGEMRKIKRKKEAWEDIKNPLNGRILILQ
jgi:hypothetical protein